MIWNGEKINQITFLTPWPKVPLVGGAGEGSISQTFLEQYVLFCVLVQLGWWKERGEGMNWEWKENKIGKFASQSLGFLIVGLFSSSKRGGKTC